MGDVNTRIRAVLGRVGRLPVPVSALADDSDLHDAGLTSFGTVDLMLSLEDEFGIEFPEELVARARFSSIAAIGAAVRAAMEVSTPR